jgi:hypothetical protein
MPRSDKLAVALMAFALVDAVLALVTARRQPLLSAAVLALCAGAAFAVARRLLCGHCRAPLRGSRYLWTIDGRRRRVCFDCNLSLGRKKFAAFNKQIGQAR